MQPSALLPMMIRLINLYNTKAKKPYTYANGMTLYPAQVHMLAMVGEQQGLTVTRIAETYKITKSAVSQITSCLEEKGLLTKSPAPQGGRTATLSLTNEGQQVLAEHHERHRILTQEVTALAETLPPETLDTLEAIATAIEENIGRI